MNSALDFGLAGKTAIVTGGGSGIGRATAMQLGAAGVKLAVFDVDVLACKSLQDEFDNCGFWPVNVADAEQVNGAVASVVDRFGDIDMLVNNAGIAPPTTLGNMSDGDWEQVIETNLTGAYNCTRAVVAQMAENGGSIVNVSSVAGKNISLGSGMHYTASKWGLIGLSRHMAYELAPQGIRVNIVCPGPTLTPLMERNLTPQKLENIATGIPLGRVVEAGDVANAILFFLSPLSTMCTGSELIVDGGILVGSGNTYDNYFESRGGKTPNRKIAPKED